MPTRAAAIKCLRQFGRDGDPPAASTKPGNGLKIIENYATKRSLPDDFILYRLGWGCVAKRKIRPTYPRGNLRFTVPQIATVRSPEKKLEAADSGGSAFPVGPRLGSLNSNGADDGEGAKTVEPRTEEAEATEAGAERGRLPGARTRAGGSQRRSGWRARSDRLTERQEISDQRRRRRACGRFGRLAEQGARPRAHQTAAGELGIGLRGASWRWRGCAAPIGSGPSPPDARITAMYISLADSLSYGFRKWADAHRPGNDDDPSGGATPIAIAVPPVGVAAATPEAAASPVARDRSRAGQ
jgi:hypothetical protein